MFSKGYGEGPGDLGVVFELRELVPRRGVCGSDEEHPDLFTVSQRLAYI